MPMIMAGMPSSRSRLFGQDADLSKIRVIVWWDYPLKKTISANGGFAPLPPSGYLVEIEEQTQIEAHPEGISTTRKTA